jgi:L-aspartate oxidase
MMQHTRRMDNVEIWEETFTIDLLTEDGCCQGALVSQRDRPPMMVWAKQTILATGGCGQVFRETTNPRVATGDGHALAFRAGAVMRDMEFMQFHPTVLYIAGSSRTLITEAIRGEGAYLIDNTGYRFMGDYDARLELAPRDIVSQSIVRQMEKTQHPCVYLTMKHLDAGYVRSRFPGIAQVCKSFGLDIATDRIPVRPGAHYMVGGVTVDQDGRTSVPGLWAAGEVTSSGLHGANRLASNSLLEGLVYGKRCGQGASDAATGISGDFHVARIASLARERSTDSFDLADIRNAMQSLMWRQVGVQRSEERLQDAFQAATNYAKYVLLHTFDNKTGWELQNLLTVALLMSYAALQRRESRGVHLRIDYPKIDEANWCRHLVIQRS